MISLQHLRHFRLALILIFSLFCTSRAAWAEDAPPSFEQLFKAGVQSYQKKEFEQARDAFTKSLEIDSQNVSALTNLALAQFQLGQKGFAVALLRKAHSLDPDFSTPEAALKFVLPQLEVKEIPHEIQLWESLRSQLLSPVPVTAYLILTALLMFSSGWILLSFLGARKRALKDDSRLPAFPLIGFLLGLGLIASGSLCALKIYDFQVPRATVISEKISVLSAPDQKAPTLFELYGGLEVIVLSANQDWVQVNYPGALSGWIPKTSVLHTSGKAPW